jgi:hypothetical protein
MRLQKTKQPFPSRVLKKVPEKKLRTRRKNLLEPLTSIHIFGCRGFKILSFVPMCKGRSS